MEEGRFRNKIYWFTFFFSILVIWIHSANAEAFLGRTEACLVYTVEYFIGNVAAQIAVPGFFMISSYLFYRNFSMDKLKMKWHSRIRTVLVPFIVWNFLYYIGYVLASRIDGLKEIVGKGQIPFGLLETGDAILHYTYNYVFWYLYQLILLILFAPVIYTAVKGKGTGILAGAAILFAISRGYQLKHLNLDALLYYGTAAFAAVHGKELAEGEWSRKRLAAGAALAAAGIGSILLSQGGLYVVFVVLFRLFLPIALWLMVDEQRLPEARTWMKDNFFLYATHFALVRLINKTGAAALPHIAAVPLTLYLLMPVCCIAVSSLTAAAMKKMCPALWGLLTGGRNPLPAQPSHGRMR